jgi:phospholipase D1/2
MARQAYCSSRRPANRVGGTFFATVPAEQIDMDRSGWIRVVGVLILCGVVAALWRFLPTAEWDVDAISAWMAPHRHVWYGLPLVMLAFISLAMVPVMLLIAATGVAFGPILGPIYAMAGCLASGSVAFAIGRWLGRRRVEQLGGERVARMTRALKRNGTLAVFFVRKIPLPFTLANVIVGASTVSYRDFVLGTLLGMVGLVIGLAGFGYQLTMVLRSPSAATVAGAVLIVSIPLTLAWVLNRSLRARSTA